MTTFKISYESGGVNWNLEFIRITKRYGFFAIDALFGSKQSLIFPSLLLDAHRKFTKMSRGFA